MGDWSDSFWGEGNRGFEILLSNLKNGPIAIEEFQRFLTESAQCESTYYKNLTRLQSQFVKSPYVGTFTPIWNLMRHLLDKICSAHLSTVNFYQDLLRDIHNYQDLYLKKFKFQMNKDGDINRTPDLITQLNNSLNTVNKAKEQYYSIAVEYERAKRSGNNSSNMSSTSTTQDTHSPSLAQSAINSLALRHTDRLERKYRQAQDEYKSTIEKYNSLRNDYEKRFADASMKFQAFEIDHIEKMLAFSLNYSELIQRNSALISAAQNEFNNKLKLLTGSELLDSFVEQKKTGTDRPAVLQFEEVDNLKASISSPSELPNAQEDSNLYNPQEFNLPSFQAHFSIPSPNTKQPDNNRALGTHSPSNDSTMSPANNNSTPVTSMPSNSSLTRSQEGNEQTSNPFDVIIKKSKFPAIFGSKRLPKDKKVDKKQSTDNKSRKIPNIRRSGDETNGSNLQNSNFESTDLKSMTDNNDDFIHLSSNKLNTRSSSSISNDDTNHRHNEGRHPFPSSKSSSSSETSDDDDNPMTKIFVKINQPKTQALSDEDDEMKISSAMRLVDLNMGNFAPNSRGLQSRTPDVNKSLSGGPIGTRPLPPVPSSSATTNTVDPSSMFPALDEFSQTPFNAININSNNQENRFSSSQSRSDSKNTTSLSSNEDDREVANSFPNNDSMNKTTAFPILQVPRSFQLNQQARATISPMSPSIFSNNPSFNNSPNTSNEMGISPLTIGAMEQIPLAIAFQETIDVMMSGDNKEKWKSRIIGQMLISFPSSILNLFADLSRASNTLEFRVKNLENIENIVAKPGLITQNESSTDSNELIYSFDMTELNNTLRNLQEKNSSSLFFNLNVLNYRLKQFNLLNIPIEISSQWTRTFDTISVNIKYRFNCSSLPDSIRFTNNSVIFYTIITDGQQIKESSPMAEWSETEHKLSWKVPYVNNGTGNLSASVVTMQTSASENADGDNNEEPWTTSSIVKAYFIGENALFSSIDFDLIGRSYRISLLKKKILSGKYQSEPDQSEPISFFKRPTKSPVPDTSLNPSDI